MSFIRKVQLLNAAVYIMQNKLFYEINFPHPLTCVEFLLGTFIFEGFVEEVQVHFDGATGRLEVERVAAEDIFETQEAYIRSQRHLPHAVRVEVELVLDNFGKMLGTKR